MFILSEVFQFVRFIFSDNSVVVLYVQVVYSLNYVLNCCKCKGIMIFFLYVVIMYSLFIFVSYKIEFNFVIVF